MTDFVAVLLIAFLSNLFALAIAIVAFRFGKMKLGWVFTTLSAAIYLLIKYVLVQ